MKPYIKYGISSLITQICIWIFFSLGDWAFDERHLVDDGYVANFLAWPILLTIIIVPSVLYLKNRKIHFHKDNYINDDIVHIVLWAITSFITSYPLFTLINTGNWIVEQHDHGGYIDLNGLEYLLIPICQVIITIVMIVGLVVDIINKTRTKV